MDTEVLPPRAVVSLKNYLIDIPGSSILSATSEATSWRKEAMLDPLRSNRWRSTSAGQQQLVFAFGEPVTPTVLALIDPNLAAGQTVTWEFDDYSDFSGTLGTTRWYWEFQSYTPHPGRRALRWYPGASAVHGSAAIAPRSFMRLTLPNSGTGDSNGDGVADTYHQLGAIWVGTWTEMRVDFGLARTPVDPSGGVQTDGGARYFDRKRVFHQVKTKMPIVEESITLDLLDDIDDAGTSRHVLYDIWASRSDEPAHSQGTYYGFLGDRGTIGDMVREIASRDSFSFTFQEARA